MWPLLLTVGALGLGTIILLRLRNNGGSKKPAAAKSGTAVATLSTGSAAGGGGAGAAPRRFILRRKYMISHDTALLSFEPHRDDVRTMGPLHLAAGRHMYVFFDTPKGPQKRPYSPIHNDEKHMDIVVKRYPNGVGSVYMHNLAVGDVANFRGPSGRFDYSGIANGSITHIGMLAGGTGITPMYQLLRHIFESSLTPKPTVHLLFSNRTAADTLLGDELRAMAAEHPSLKVEFIYSCVKRCDDVHISSSFAHFIETGGLTLICGPDSYQRTMIDIMSKVGWSTTSETHRLFVF